jgi:hypothetical protein
MVVKSRLLQLLLFTMTCQHRFEAFITYYAGHVCYRRGSASQLDDLKAHPRQAVHMRRSRLCSYDKATEMVERPASTVPMQSGEM